MLSARTFTREERVRWPWSVAGDWNLTHLYDQTFELDAVNGVDMTGSTIETVYPIPLWHRLREVELLLLDSGGDPTTDSVDIIIYRENAGRFLNFYTLEGGSLDSGSLILSQIDMASRATRYKFNLSSASGNVVWLTLRIDVL